MEEKAKDVVMRATGMLAVPQVEINGHWIVGFDPGQIEQQLNH